MDVLLRSHSATDNVLDCAQQCAVHCDTNAQVTVDNIAVLAMGEVLRAFTRTQRYRRP